MNQILFSKFDTEIKNEPNRKKKSLLKFFRYQFVFSIVIILLCLSYYIYIIYDTTQKEKLSRKLLSNFNIDMIYSKNSDYDTSQITINDAAQKDSFIIGIIEIKKLKIVYPIVSDVNDDLLKMSTCRFFGPKPNEVGNLCIAAHNYNDTRFFSKIHQLNLNDSINIYDENGNMVKYLVYDKYTIEATDTKCTSQDTNGLREITLLTCNNRTGYRLVVKAREEQAGANMRPYNM